MQPNLSKTELDQNERIKRVDVEIIPITEEHIEGFWSAVDSVAREHKYLAFLKGPPVNTTRDFVLGTIEGNWPHYFTLITDKFRNNLQKSIYFGLCFTLKAYLF